MVIVVPEYVRLYTIMSSTELLLLESEHVPYVQDFLVLLNVTEETILLQVSDASFQKRR